VLVASLGTPLVEALPVTTIQWPDSPRASFRLTLADGHVLKGRRFRTPADVARVACLSSLLDPRHFPQVLAHHGCALLTRWIPGHPAGLDSWTPTRLRSCGRLQAGIHQVPVSGAVTSLEPALPWTVRLDRWIGELVDGGALDTGRGSQIHRLVTLSAPSTTRTSVCHTDFCGDNIIITDPGDICVVDNEGLSVDSPEFDLARTWYRWPMTTQQQRAFAEGYGAHDYAAPFAAHFLHWALLALLDSAAYRTRARVVSARVPLERLAGLLRTQGRDESFPRFLGCGGR
jgi:hypothetical protein